MGLVEDSLLGMHRSRYKTQHCKEEKTTRKISYTNSRLVSWDIPEATIIGQGCYN